MYAAFGVVMRARMTQIQENIRDSGAFGLAKSNNLWYKVILKGYSVFSICLTSLVLPIPDMEETVSHPDAQ